MLLWLLYPRSRRRGSRLSYRLSLKSSGYIGLDTWLFACNFALYGVEKMSTRSCLFVEEDVKCTVMGIGKSIGPVVIDHQTGRRHVSWLIDCLLRKHTKDTIQWAEAAFKCTTMTRLNVCRVPHAKMHVPWTAPQCRHPDLAYAQAILWDAKA